MLVPLFLNLVIGERPYHCKHCDKSFATTISLKTHTYIHTGEKPHKCPHCPKTFATSSKLGRHIVTHSEQRPFACEHCPKSFNRSGKTFCSWRIGDKKIVFECWKIFLQVIATILLNLRKEFDISKWPFKNVLLILLLNYQWHIIPFPFVFCFERPSLSCQGKVREFQSVKGYCNSAFLRKDQLCYLKRAEKLTFCIYFL